MKIGLLGPFPPFRGGIATFDAELLQELQRSSVDAVALNYRRLYPKLFFPGKSQLDETSATPFSVSSLSLFDPYAPQTWPAARRTLTALRLDALWVSWWTPLLGPFLWMFLRKWKKRANAKVTVICHNVAPHESIPTGAWWTRRALGLADTLVAHWQGDAATLGRWFPKARVLPLFHPTYELFPDDPSVDRAKARAALGLGQTGRSLLFFGLVRPYKGLDTLLRAFALLAEEETDLTLVVAGEFYEKQERYAPLLRPLLEKGRLVLRDHFVPNEQVMLYLKAADAVVLPYRSATQSGVVPLVYSFGRGVVTTRVGGLGEMVADGVSGQVCPPDDPAALASAIRLFLARQSEIEANVPRFAQRFSKGRYVKSLIEDVPSR